MELEIIKMKNLLVVLSFVFLAFLPSAFASENESIISIGEKDAKITIKVFSSLTCPHCANFHMKIFKKLQRDYIDTKIVRRLGDNS